MDVRVKKKKPISQLGVIEKAQVLSGAIDNGYTPRVRPKYKPNLVVSGFTSYLFHFEFQEEKRV